MILHRLTRHLGFFFIALFASIGAAHAGEPWKGKTTVRPYEFGLMSGVSIYGNDASWGILPSAAYLVRDQGFIDDIDDRAWVELQLGPTFFTTGSSTQAGIQYSAHLRWDFTYNEQWTFYALGGLSGYGLPDQYQNSFTIHPRFGTGVQYQTKTPLMFRGEVSAEFIGLGVALQF